MNKNSWRINNNDLLLKIIRVLFEKNSIQIAFKVFLCARVALNNLL